MPRHRKDDGSSPWVAAGSYMGLGLQWALAVLLFGGIGWWVDGLLGTRPWLAVAGAFVGGAAGFYSLYHHVFVRMARETPPPEDREGHREEGE